MNEAQKLQIKLNILALTKKHRSEDLEVIFQWVTEGIDFNPTIDDNDSSVVKLYGE